MAMQTSAGMQAQIGRLQKAVDDLEHRNRELTGRIAHLEGRVSSLQTAARDAAPATRWPHAGVETRRKKE